MSAAIDLLAGLVSDRGPRWGDLATSWQWDDAVAILDPGPDDPRQHWLARPKGGSKSTDVAGVSIAWLVEQSGDLDEGYVLASDEDQANRLLNRARGFVSRTPGLDAEVAVQGDRILNRKNGATVTALAADVAGNEGLLSPFIVVEELPNWATTPTARGLWTAAFSAIPKWPGMTFVVIGHAGDPGHWSYKILEHARTAGAWRVVEIPGPLEWVSPDALVEQEALLLPSQFQRRHLNRWTAGEDKLTTREDVLACVGHVGDLAPVSGRQYVVTLDVGLTNDRTVAAVVHTEKRDQLTVVLDRMQVWQGSPDKPVDLSVVEAWVAGACRDYGALLRFDPYQAQHLAQRLAARRVRTEAFTFTQASIGRIAVTLFRLLRDHALDLPDDDELIDELANVRLRETSPGVYRVDHDQGAHDDRAIALGIAAAHLVDRSPEGTGQAHSGIVRGQGSLPTRGDFMASRSPMNTASPFLRRKLRDIKQRGIR